MVVVVSVLLGLVYPLVVTAIGQVAFNDKADGSLIEVDGVVVGSELLGQSFVAPEYFHSRPSAAGAGYDGSASSGSNLGPTNPDFLAVVDERVAAYRQRERAADDTLVPVDAVTASALGSRPRHLGRQRPAAGATCRRRTRPRRSTTSWRWSTTTPPAAILLVLGEPAVQVVALNLALDELSQGDSRPDRLIQ